MWLVIFKYLKYYPFLLKGKIKIKEKRYKIKYPQKKNKKFNRKRNDSFIVAEN